jgi:hypothetical protein
MIASCHIHRHPALRCCATLEIETLYEHRLDVWHVEEKMSLILTSSLDRAERQTLSPRKKTAYHRWKGGLHFSSQAKAARGQQVAHDKLCLSQRHLE